jgi:NAD+-dependent secondary alcohol dehydrogenase Adh1
VAQALAMLARGGTWWVVGYGGTVAVPAIDRVARQVQVAGSLVGTHVELAELMGLVARGLVELRTTEYRLEDVNDAIAALRAGELRGRAVIVP